MINNTIQTIRIADLDLSDPFFDSLRDDYIGFDDWLERKRLEFAQVQFNNFGRLTGFLYLKDEEESNNLISPPFNLHRRLKVGTFKIMAHGTTLGQHFIRIILTNMLTSDYDFTYVTVFEKQVQLIELFKKFGFKKWGQNSNGEEVYYKDLTVMNDAYLDFPRVNLSGNSKQHLLAIKPEYHTDMFPDSILKTERDHVIQDLSVTNTCEKIYICASPNVLHMNSGDNVVIYRTADKEIPAEYSSVATTICTVVETRDIKSFGSQSEFIDYCSKGSIFPLEKLNYFWSRQYPRFIVKMLYNVSLNKRLTRGRIADELDISRNLRWNCIELQKEQFQHILEMGEVCESFIIN